MRLFAALALAITLAACGAPPPPPSERDKLVGPLNEKGKYILVVLDVSGSMTQSDPRRLSEEGAHLAVSLAGSEDNFGAVTFSSSADIRSKLSQIGPPSSRRDAHRNVMHLPRHGETNYVDAMKWAYATFAAANAPEGSAVIFFTDGEHNVGGSQEDVFHQADQFRDKNWNIFTVGLEDGRESDLLRRMAVATRGAHFPVEKAEDLVKAFLTILGQVHNFMIYDGEPHPVRLFTGTNRLVYVGIKETPDGHIAGLKRDDAPVDAKAADYNQYPELVDRKSSIEAVSVEHPPAGVWIPQIEGKLRLGAILQQPSFLIRLDDQLLKREYYEGEKIEVSLIVEKADPELLKLIQGKGSASVSLRTEGAAGDLGTLKLLPQNSQGVQMRFTGIMTSKTPASGKPELQTISAQFSLPEEGGGIWNRETRVSIMARPGQRPIGFAVSPAVVDFGSRWSDSGVASAKVKLSATARNVDAKLKSRSPLLTLSSPRVTVTTAGTDLEISLDPSKVPPGDFTTVVEVDTQQADALSSESREIKVQMRVARLPGGTPADAFSLGRKAQGEAWDVPVKLAVEGGSGTITATALSGPGEIATKTDGGRFSGKIPPDAKSGEYKGTLTLRVPGFPDRSFPTSIQVGAATATFDVEPKQVVIEANKKGTHGQELRIRMNFPRDAELIVEKSALKAAGVDAPIREGSVSWLPNEAEWDGKKLAPGKDVHVTIQIRVTGDTYDGEYSGKIKITVPGENGPAGLLEIPVLIKVKQ